MKDTLTIIFAMIKELTIHKTALQQKCRFIMTFTYLIISMLGHMVCPKNRKIVTITSLHYLTSKNNKFRRLIPTMAKKILLIHGPNLNLLGTREPEKYGTVSLKDIEENALSQVKAFDANAQFAAFQHNHEGSIVDRIHDAQRQDIDFIVINAGAYTHTSVAIRDALLGVDIPFIELHITNVHAREEFRHKSFLADKAVAVVSGLGPIYGYKAAIDFALNYTKK